MMFTKLLLDKEMDDGEYLRSECFGNYFNVE